MTTSEPGVDLAALRRARAMLTPAAAAVAAQPAASSDGYLDLLDRELESTGRTQDLMTSSFVPRIYERWWRPALARAVKGLTGPGMSEEVRIARLLMGLEPGDSVLDLACGPGNFSREFAVVVGEAGLVVGVDASRTMLRRGAGDLAASRLANVALVRGDAEALPFRDASFDAACCFATFSPTRSGRSTRSAACSLRAGASRS